MTNPLSPELIHRIRTEILDRLEDTSLHTDYWKRIRADLDSHADRVVQKHVDYYSDRHDKRIARWKKGSIAAIIVGFTISVLGGLYSITELVKDARTQAETQFQSKLLELEHKISAAERQLSTRMENLLQSSVEQTSDLLIRNFEKSQELADAALAEFKKKLQAAQRTATDDIAKVQTVAQSKVDTVVNSLLQGETIDGTELKAIVDLYMSESGITKIPGGGVEIQAKRLSIVNDAGDTIIDLGKTNHAGHMTIADPTRRNARGEPLRLIELGLWPDKKQRIAILNEQGHHAAELSANLNHEGELVLRKSGGDLHTAIQVVDGAQQGSRRGSLEMEGTATFRALEIRRDSHLLANITGQNGAGAIGLYDSDHNFWRSYKNSDNHYYNELLDINGHQVAMLFMSPDGRGQLGIGRGPRTYCSLYIPEVNGEFIGRLRLVWPKSELLDALISPMR